MTIVDIIEIQNKFSKNMTPIKEKMDIYIPDIKNENISRRNGMIYILCGSGGSGKTSLLLNMFKNKNYYRNVFNRIYYFCPMSSFLSVQKHPFEKHDRIYHELTVPDLEQIYDELLEIKERAEAKRLKKIEKDKKKKVKNKEIIHYESESDYEISINSESDDEEDIQYSCIIIDDFADQLKDNDIQRQLNKMLIKSRHSCCSFIFSIQSYIYFPRMLRKQITFATIYKTGNVEEWYDISKEMLNYKQDDALKLYDYVFDKPYNHLDVDTKENKIYKNFNLLEIKK
jgi:type II secretory ATPase GspE/PulE/Tfp pilus assembly ATPase PilB-like protein